VSFSGLNIGLSSLYAQRRGLEVTGHNIANANTEGYSRQRVRLEADSGPITPAYHSRWNGAGNGVVVADVQRLRDVFLESRAVHERGSEAGLRGRALVLGRVEAILSEPGDLGLQSQLSEFWSGWDDIANQPTDLAGRSQLLQRAQTLATGINQASARLDGQWSASREQLQATVQDINATAEAVAQLNAGVMAATKAGLSPNDLSDQRDLLVQRLGDLAGVSLRAGDAGSVDVFVGGTALVRGATAERLAVRGASELTTPAGTVSVAWEKDGFAAPAGGAAAGLQAGLNEVLPRYRDGLDALAGALRTTVNTQHRLGTDAAGLAGGDFFSGTSAADLRVAFTDPARIAASSAPVGGTGDRGGGNAAAMAELATAPGGPDALYRRTIVQLGVEAQTANRRVDIQTDILRQVEAQRESEAGVNLDEEMANMLAYQRGYEGAARFVTAIDQMLDTLINRTGLVGR
jgi:flagellar hook-associated protein 1 FlgK